MKNCDEGGEVRLFVLAPVLVFDPVSSPVPPQPLTAALRVAGAGWELPNEEIR